VAIMHQRRGGRVQGAVRDDVVNDEEERRVHSTKASLA
jgi:hypothetical protein